MEQNYLMHFGVKGMHWGQHLSTSITNKKTIRTARKDAKEYARAKMFYGEGAGTRRKLIKAKVKERSKNKLYSEEFHKALNNQNMAKHADKAKQERKVKDTANAAKKTGRGVVNILTGNTERLGAGMAAGYGVYQIAKKTGADKVVAKKAKQTAKSISRSIDLVKTKMFLRKYGL